MELTEKYAIIFEIVGIVLILVLTWILTRVNHSVFKKIYKKKEGLHLIFFERLIGAGILIGGIILAFSTFGGFDSIWKTVIGGTAIVSTVLAFAAQDAIKDILAGLMISIYKPFEIGNRIELDDGTAGIVKDITMRHIVLQQLDTQQAIVPNSKLNTMKIKNYSYHVKTRSAMFQFYIAYHSDVEMAMAVIRQAIIDSELSIPGKETPDGPAYADVYFMAYEECSLRLATTVYFEATTPSEVLITDINLRVNHALAENGIEIPYPYLNIIEKK